jgi:hypothetical protein
MTPALVLKNALLLNPNALLTVICQFDLLIVTSIPSGALIFNKSQPPLPLNMVAFSLEASLGILHYFAFPIAHASHV